MLIGVVGKANVGKSTFFKALTLADAQIANYPFTTIAPNRGMAYARVKCACSDFKVKCSPIAGSCIDGTRFVPIELMDVAGLVPDAHKGVGLPQVVEELVPAALPEMRPRHEPRHIHELDGDEPLAVDAAPHDR